MQKFEKIYIELTNFCGLHCTFCTPQKGEEIMPLELFAKIAKEIAPFSKLCTLHILGDPLKLKNLESYLKIAENLALEITTSGFYPAPLESLLNYKNIKQINISLTSALYQKQKINLEKYLKPILDFCTTHKARKSEKFINLRVWNLNKAKVPPQENAELYTLLERYFNCKTNPIKTRLSYKIHLIGASFFKWQDSSLSKNTQGFCLGGQKQLGILQSGIVTPCCFDTQGQIALGDLKTQGFLEILQSRRLYNLTQGFKENKRVESFCQTCPYPAYLENKNI